MSLLHVTAAFPCCLFMLHVHDAYACCMPMLQVYATCPCCTPMLHVLFGNSVLHVHAACRLCISMLHVHAACPCHCPLRGYFEIYTDTRTPTTRNFIVSIDIISRCVVVVPAQNLPGSCAPHPRSVPLSHCVVFRCFL